MLGDKAIASKVERGFGVRLSVTEAHGALDGSGIKASIKSRRGEAEQRELERIGSRDAPEAGGEMTTRTSSPTLPDSRFKNCNRDR